MSVYLAPNFTLYELTRSGWALRHGESNHPADAHVEALKALCREVLQPIRNFWGPVHINSGYRSPAVNKGIGGSPSSQHMRGEAADIEVYGVSNLDVARWIRDNLAFDQLILEHHYPPAGPNSGWVHVSYVRPTLGGRANRHDVLTKPQRSRRFYRGLPGESHGRPGD